MSIGCAKQSIDIDELSCYDMLMLNNVKETPILADGRFRLKARDLVDRHGKTPYRVAKDGGVNYSTILRWTSKPEEVDGVNGRALYGFLMGLGLSLEQVNDLRFGDVFEFTPTEGTDAGE